MIKSNFKPNKWRKKYEALVKKLDKINADLLELEYACPHKNISSHRSDNLWMESYTECDDCGKFLDRSY